MRAALEKYGEAEIYEVKICRKPVFPVIERLANLLSSGKWEENKEKLSYDKMFHLFILLRLAPMKQNGEEKILKVEKNHVVEIRPSTWDTDGDTESVPYSTDTGMSLNKMFRHGIKAVGESKFWIYDARTQNCQYFVRNILSGYRSWNSNVEKFVLQDAEKVLENLGLLGKVAKVATDIAGVADVALNGRGRRRGYGGRR